MPRTAWPSLTLARRHDAAARVPLVVDGHRVGSVARAQLGALARLAARGTLSVGDTQVEITAPPATRDADWSALDRRLRAEGLIAGWRDEAFSVFAPGGGQVLAVIERAAARFWGTLTLGAHATGYVAGAAGRPQRLWIARRAMTKATDPGRRDNLIGGGVPHGQSPFEALVREGWEEAGLAADAVRRARPGAVIELRRDLPEGLQHEHLHAYDLELPAGTVPVNQDGEVDGFECLPVDAALALAASGAMTVDAELVTLDFALRHGLLNDAPRWHAALAPLLAGGSPPVAIS